MSIEKMNKRLAAYARTNALRNKYVYKKYRKFQNMHLYVNMSKIAIVVAGKDLNQEIRHLIRKHRDLFEIYVVLKHTDTLTMYDILPDFIFTNDVFSADYKYIHKMKNHGKAYLLFGNICCSQTPSIWNGPVIFYAAISINDDDTAFLNDIKLENFYSLGSVPFYYSSSVMLCNLVASMIPYRRVCFAGLNGTKRGKSYTMLQQAFIRDIQNVYTSNFVYNLSEGFPELGYDIDLLKNEINNLINEGGNE